MKKIITASLVLVMMLSGKISAQVTTVQGKVTLKQADGTKVPVQLIKEGENSLVLDNNKGTLKFVKRGSSFSNVVFVDSRRETQTLTITAGGANGAPRPECNSPLPDICFATADKNIGLCICKTNKLSADESESYAFLARIGELKVRGVAILQGTAKNKTKVRDGATLQLQ